MNLNDPDIPIIADPTQRDAELAANLARDLTMRFREDRWSPVAQLALVCALASWMVEHTTGTLAATEEDRLGAEVWFKHALSGAVDTGLDAARHKVVLAEEVKDV